MPKNLNQDLFAPPTEEELAADTSTPASTPDLFAPPTEEELKAPMGVAEAAGIGAKSGLTWSMGDELKGFSKEPVGALKKAASFIPGVDYSKDPDVKKYMDVVTPEREQYARALAEHPAATLGGELTGGLPWGFLGLASKGRTLYKATQLGKKASELKKASNIAKMVGTAEATTEASKLASIAEKAKRAQQLTRIHAGLKASKAGAAMGGAYGLGASSKDTLSGLGSDIAKSTLVGGVAGPAVEFGLSGGAKLLQGGAKALKGTAKAPGKIAQTIAGVREKSWNMMTDPAQEITSIADSEAPKQFGENINKVLLKKKQAFTDAENALVQTKQEAGGAWNHNTKAAQEAFQNAKQELDELISQQSGASKEAISDVKFSQSQTKYQAQQQLDKLKDEEKLAKALSISENQNLALKGIQNINALSVSEARAGKAILTDQPLLAFNKVDFLNNIKEQTFRLPTGEMSSKILEPSLYAGRKSGYDLLATRIKQLPDQITEKQAKRVIDDLGREAGAWYNRIGQAVKNGEVVTTGELSDVRAIKDARTELLNILELQNTAYEPYAKKSKELIELADEAVTKLTKGNIAKGLASPASAEGKLFSKIVPEPAPYGLPLDLQRQQAHLQTIAQPTPEIKQQLLQEQLNAGQKAASEFASRIEFTESAVDTALQKTKLFTPEAKRDFIQKAIAKPQEALQQLKDTAGVLTRWFPESQYSNKVEELVSSAISGNEEAKAALRLIGKEAGPEFQTLLNKFETYLDFYKNTSSASSLLGTLGRVGGTAVGQPYIGGSAGYAAGNTLGIGRQAIGRGMAAVARSLPGRTVGGAWKGGLSGLAKIVQYAPDKLGPYAEQISKAASMGNLPIVHYRLMINDPKYREIMHKVADESE